MHLLQLVEPVARLSVKYRHRRDQLTRRSDYDHYINEMRSIQPEGPYYLGGFCLGSYVALEMVHQLEADGQEVGLGLRRRR